MCNVIFNTVKNISFSTSSTDKRSNQLSIIHTVTVTNKLHNICNLTTFKSIFVFACSYNYRECTCN